MRHKPAIQMDHSRRRVRRGDAPLKMRLTSEGASKTEYKQRPECGEHSVQGLNPTLEERAPWQRVDGEPGRA